MSPSRNGFTLIEVAFSIAILAFALVTMIGLLTVGLSAEKSSVENTRMAAMAGYVMASERMNSFTNVSASGYTTNYYFDLQGNATNAASTATAPYLECIVTNNASAINTNTGIADFTILNPVSGITNVVPMKMLFIYPLPAPANTNVFYFNRSNE
jgi:uncharacterized protein (TIGR02598 family)